MEDGIRVHSLHGGITNTLETVGDNQHLRTRSHGSLIILRAVSY